MLSWASYFQYLNIIHKFMKLSGIAHIPIGFKDLLLPATFIYVAKSRTCSGILLYFGVEKNLLNKKVLCVKLSKVLMLLLPLE